MSDAPEPTVADAPVPLQAGDRVYVQCAGYRHETTFERHCEKSSLACYVRGHGRILLSRVTRR